MVNADNQLSRRTQMMSLPLVCTGRLMQAIGDDWAEEPAQQEDALEFQKHLIQVLTEESQMVRCLACPSKALHLGSGARLPGSHRAAALMSHAHLILIVKYVLVHHKLARK